MKRQKQQVYAFLKKAMISLMFLHVFFPLTAVSSHDDLAFLSSPADRVNNLPPENKPILPEWDAPLDPDFDQRVPVVYDHRTRTAKSHSPYPACKSCIADATDYYNPNESPKPDLSNELVTGVTASAVTQNPEVWPNSPTVRIMAVWPSGHTSVCSGMLVDKSHLLTAAHCTFTHSPELCIDGESCWVDDLHITTDANLDAEQSVSFTKILTWTSWTENRDFDDDLAAVALTSPLGEEIGWLGFGYHNDPEESFFPAANFEYTSYPTQSPYDGETMSTWMGQFSTISETKFYSADPCQEGQSGAASHNPDANHIIYSVLSHTLKINDASNTGHTRITSEKFDAIRDLIKGVFNDLPLQHYIPIIIQ